MLSLMRVVEVHFYRSLHLASQGDQKWVLFMDEQLYFNGEVEEKMNVFCSGKYLFPFSYIEFVSTKIH